MKYLVSICVAAAMLGGCGEQISPNPRQLHLPPLIKRAPNHPLERRRCWRPHKTTLPPVRCRSPLRKIRVRLSGPVMGLPPNAEFGFHIHEKKAIAARLRPQRRRAFQPLGRAARRSCWRDVSRGRHVQREVRCPGAAQIEADVTGVSLGGGQPDDVLGKAVVMHEKPDDYSTQPSGQFRRSYRLRRDRAGEAAVVRSSDATWVSRAADQQVVDGREVIGAHAIADVNVANIHRAGHEALIDADAQHRGQNRWPGAEQPAAGSAIVYAGILQHVAKVTRPGRDVEIADDDAGVRAFRKLATERLELGVADALRAGITGQLRWAP